MTPAIRGLLAAGALTLLAGTAQAQTPAAAGPPKKGGTIQMIVTPEPPGLMLGLVQNGPSQMVAGNIYESLLRYDEKLNPQPSLAKSWEVSPDQKSTPSACRTTSNGTTASRSRPTTWCSRSTSSC